MDDGKRPLLLAVVLISIAGLFQTASAVEHIVGGEGHGWALATENYFDNWAAGQDIRVGDTLKFTWSGTHDVVQLSTADTQACNVVGNKFNKWTSPGVSVPLQTAGTFGYVCSIGTHCNDGSMRMTVTVKATGNSPPAPFWETSPPPPGSVFTPGTSSDSSFGSPPFIVALVVAIATLIVE
ncbi:hypothetical protein R1flu_005638 [Riccia fluitans]|uniref:Phytocyanin domain-containing protein n=1 Tax=Riccia fluitans TaxID=41844 RepID=A0ABD1YTQ4_9MARC